MVKHPGGTNPPLWSSSNAPSSRPLTPRPPSEAEALASLRADLEVARGEYTLRHFDTVGRLLEKVAGAIQTPLPANAPTEYEAERSFLRGSLLCLQGRLLTSTRHPQEADKAFQEAVALFESQQAEISERRKTFASRFLENENTELERQRSASRILTDYGIALARTGRPDEAVALLREVCDSGAAPAEAFGYLGRAYQKQGNLTEAESALKKGVLVAPNDPKLLQYLAETFDATQRLTDAAAAYCDAGRAAWRVGDLPEAARLIHRAVEIEPTRPQALELAVNIELEGGNVDRALKFVDELLRLEPRHVWALGMKGAFLRQAGDVGGAVEILRLADVQTAGLAWILLELAWSLQQLDAANNAEALAVLERALQLDPRNGQAHYIQSLLLVEGGRVEEAIRSLDQAIEIEPQTAGFYCERGQLRLLIRDYDRANADFDLGLGVDPRSAKALLGKATVARAKKDLEKALGFVRRSMRLTPEDEEAFLLMIDILLEQDSFEEALDELDARIRQHPDAAAIYRRKGQLLVGRQRFVRDRKNLAKAAEAFQCAARLNPDPSILCELADALRLHGDYGQAGAAYEHALRLQPTALYAIYGQAVYLSEIGAFEQAIALLEPILKEYPTDPWLRGVQGWCLEYCGPQAMEAARAAYEIALANLAAGQDDLWYRKGLANTLMQLGQESEARKHFLRIIDERKYQTEDDPAALAQNEYDGKTNKKFTDDETLWALGWCQYSLERYDEGIRLLNSALALEENAGTVFDLGLILISTARFASAEAEYRRGVALVGQQDPLRRRGLYYVALYDLINAATEGRVGAGAVPIFVLLRDCLAESGVDLATLSWLGDGLPPARESGAGPLAA